jgi:hypothetical protein
MLLSPEWPILPWGFPINTIPIDVLARALRCLMEHADAVGKIYHLTQGTDDRVTFGDFIQRVLPILETKLGRKPKLPTYISPLIYERAFMLLRPLSWGKLKRYLESRLVLIKFMSLDWKFDNTMTRRALASVGVAIPRFDEYLPNLIEYYINHRHENRKPRFD